MVHWFWVWYFPCFPQVGCGSLAANVKLLGTGYIFFAVFCEFFKKWFVPFPFMALRFKSVVLVCSLSEDLPQAVFIFDIFKLASLAKETVRRV